MASRIWQRIGGYVLIEKLGSGGMGEVYRAEHLYLHRQAAIKLLKPALSHDAVALERFFNEARAMAAIRHPGIVEVLDCGVERGDAGGDPGGSLEGAVGAGQAFIAMELLEGGTLAARWEREPLGGARARAALAIAAEVARAVAAAHALRIVHRDLKPSNVILLAPRALDEAPPIKVLDFGVAKLAGPLSADMTGGGAFLGTPLYMSPEQCRGAGAVDERSDIYSLGCMVYEGLCGRPPFLGAGPGDLVAAHLEHQAPVVSDLIAGLPSAVDDYVACLLAKAPGDRPASMSDVALHLDHLARALTEQGANVGVRPGAPVGPRSTLTGAPVSGERPAGARQAAASTVAESRAGRLRPGRRLGWVAASTLALVAVPAFVMLAGWREEDRPVAAAATASAPGSARDPRDRDGRDAKRGITPAAATELVAVGTSSTTETLGIPAQAPSPPPRRPPLTPARPVAPAPPLPRRAAAPRAARIQGDAPSTARGDRVRSAQPPLAHGLVPIVDL